MRTRSVGILSLMADDRKYPATTPGNSTADTTRSELEMLPDSALKKIDIEMPIVNTAAMVGRMVRASALE